MMTNKNLWNNMEPLQTRITTTITSVKCGGDIHGGDRQYLTVCPYCGVEYQLSISAVVVEHVDIEEKIKSLVACVTGGNPREREEASLELAKLKDGRIVDASADDTALINAILDTDEGARYVGEFALGCNPAIDFAMDNTLFDEKIGGSIHFTPGNAYEDCDNGNRSSVHWDLVQIQTPAYGGGEIYFDGVLVRKDGLFVHEAFTALNFSKTSF